MRGTAAGGSIERIDGMFTTRTFTISSKRKPDFTIKTL